MVLNQLVDQQHLLLDLPHQPLELDLLLDLERRVHLIYIYRKMRIYPYLYVALHNSESSCGE